MPLKYVQGDPMLTSASVLAFGHNAKGRTEMDDFSMLMRRKYPAAFSSYLRQARKDRQKGGDIYTWSESKPRLLFLTIRDSSVGATRLRYVQKVLITIARDYPLYNIASLAIAPLGNQYERSEIENLYATWFNNITLPVVIYTEYESEIKADETFEE